MQHISGDVLQELQQQGEAQAEQQSRRPGEAYAEGRGMAPRASEASEASLSDPSQDGVRTSSSTSSLVGEAPRPPRRWSQETSRRRSRAQSQTSPPELSRYRSRPGSGTPSPPLRIPTSSAIPSQLLGGRLGTNADVLTAKSTDTAVSATKYHSARKESTAEHLRSLLSPHLSSRQETGFLPSIPQHDLNSPSATPGSGTSGSSSSPTAGSIGSKQSAASSFAYFIRNRPSYRRLLSRKTKPSRHLSTHTHDEHSGSGVKRSPSYYVSKVIEDTYVPPAPSAGTLTPAQSTTPVLPMTDPKPPSYHAHSPVRSLRKSPSCDTPAQPDSPSQVYSPGASRSTLQRPAIVRSLSSQEVPSLTSPPAQIRFQSLNNPPRSANFNRQARETPRATFRTQMRISLPQASISLQVPERRHYHDVTPPESEPRTPDRSMFVHGDSYFRTFGGETVYMKDFTPTMVPVRPDQPTPPKAVSQPPADLLAQATGQTDIWTHKPQKRKRSCFFKFMRKAEVVESTDDAPEHAFDATLPSAQQSSPYITISSPFERLPKRRRSDTRSDAPSQSYFTQRRRRNESSEATPSSAKSPMSVDSSDGDRRSVHLRSSSSTGDLSSTARPRTRPRLRHRHTLASMDENEGETPTSKQHADVAPAMLSKAASDPLSRHVPTDRKDYSKTAVTDPGAPELLPTQTEEVNEILTKPIGGDRKRLSSIKKSIVDLSAHLYGDLKVPSASPEPVSILRQLDRASKSSAAALLHKASLSHINKLKHKASQATVATAVRSKPSLQLTNASLEVTNFHQTPFSQRYSNTLRAEATQIRTYVDEALDDDDNDDIVLGFELNVPDHLPNSPLCPLSPRHKSGGKAICPLHGRKKKAVPVPVSKISKAKTIGPTIVYECGPGGDGQGGSTVCRRVA